MNITVRNANNTYRATAKGSKLAATNTAGPRQAAESLARKLGIDPALLREESSTQFTTTFRVATKTVEELQQEVRMLNMEIAQLKSQSAPDMKAMVDRFLSWPLPNTLCADPCATIPCYGHRTGTNLMTAVEAMAMLEHMLERRP